MPRTPRIRSGSGCYHVMLRGINRQTIFESDDDRHKFISTLKEYIDAEKLILYGYCLMNNHVHLLVKEQEDDISTAIKRISGSYVFWYNKKYERCGHLFQERFKSEPIETDAYLMTALRYIHQNPIKAKLCKDMMDYKWMSYKEYIKKPIIIESEFCLNLFSNNRKTAIELFREYTNEQNEDICLEIDDYYKLTDDEVIEMICDMGVRNISELQQFEKQKRNSILKKMKSIKGVTIRQLARITGISKSLISNL